MPYLICGIISLGLWFMVVKGFSVVVVWFCEGGWYKFINGYELWWDGVREPILLGVGIMIAFFMLSMIIGLVVNCRGRRTNELFFNYFC